MFLLIFFVKCKFTEQIMYIIIYGSMVNVFEMLFYVTNCFRINGFLITLNIIWKCQYKFNNSLHMHLSKSDVQIFSLFQKSKPTGCLTLSISYTSNFILRNWTEKCIFPKWSTANSMNLGNYLHFIWHLLFGVPI